MSVLDDINPLNKNRDRGSDAYTGALKMAGFKGEAEQTMFAIGYAESGLKPQARHVNSDGSIDRGWLQINNKAHPDVSDSCAFNIFCSAKAAYNISNHGTDFSPWTTYTSGAYKQYLGKAYVNTPLPDKPGFNVGNPLDFITSGINSTGDILKFFANFLVDITSGAFWLRVIKVIIGAFLLLMSLNMFSKVALNTDVARSARKAAKTTAVVAAIK